MSGSVMPGAERGREHDHEADRVAGEGEPGVALRPCGRTWRAATAIQPNERDVERQRRERERAHATARCPACAADRASVSARRRIHEAPSARPRMNAESISSNECVALPSTSDEHPDPGDLVDERRDGGAEAARRAAASEAGRLDVRRLGRRAATVASPGAPAASATTARAPIVHARATTRLSIAADEQRARQARRARPGRSRRPARRPPRRGCWRSRAARASGPAASGTQAEHAGAHQRERRAEQHRLRQDEQRRDGPLRER